ncbi:MAG: cell wall hydrolase, partial [Clostridiales bacterium]|nr:cell wall hydrolase [Clostridiales bacterium]
SSKFPNSIERVIFQGSGAQFSPADNANKLRLSRPSDMCVRAVRDVLLNGSILPSEVMYFRTASKGTEWASSRAYYNTYGGNCFFS